ncbi:MULTISPECIES: helix-turn-helix transcriptional regulator [Myxococcaceae]|uniref:helix-turn-helix transcriptional regulator n=1 Tax=Myxococcaceae TaxID=31 RepID=UPI00188FC228|nr:MULTISPECIES: helix-turn-helix transcriptional regulator [Myxococcaceae]MBF5046152.1 helix-turn-helix transcriptional regulator [Simulacricoccus sp. 17bor-14]
MSRPRLDAPRGVLQRPAPPGRVVHERFAPAPALEPYVQHFWTVRWDLRGERPVCAETLPHPCVHLVFERGRAQVAGVQSRRFRRELRGQDRVFGVKFRPAAFQPLLRAPVSSLTDRTVSLRQVLGPSSDALREVVLAEPDVRACAALVQDFLAPRLPPLSAPLQLLRDLVERLAADPSLVRVEQVVELSGLSLRALQRGFRAAVGVSPKWVLKRYRLHEAAEQLARTPAPELADLALQLGYFDQSHFIRDFKALVGQPPGAYAAAATAARRLPSER